MQASVHHEASPGERLPIRLTFLVQRPCVGVAPQIFVHAAAPGSEVNQVQANHIPVGGKVEVRAWQVGDLVVDEAFLDLPAALVVESLVVRVGIVDGKKRWEVQPANAHDGQNRIEVGRIQVKGAPPLAIAARVDKRRERVTIDGVLDEVDWLRAKRLGPFLAWDGRSPLQRKTWARVLWDAEHLFVAFEGEDPDVFSPFSQDDDPLYESEAIEVFIDADGDADDYVELQAAPAHDIHFDASFRGGRRKNMDRSWGVPFVTKTVVTNVGFVSEWQIPVRALKEVPPSEPRPGATWRANFFRLERVRSGERVTRTEASAWSSPLSGDFHNLARFGTLHFVEETP